MMQYPNLEAVWKLYIFNEIKNSLLSYDKYHLFASHLLHISQGETNNNNAHMEFIVIPPSPIL